MSAKIYIIILHIAHSQMVYSSTLLLYLKRYSSTSSHKQVGHSSTLSFNQEGYSFVSSDQTLWSTLMELPIVKSIYPH